MPSKSVNVLEVRKIREDIGPLSNILVTKEGKMVNEDIDVQFPQKVQELLQNPNVAVIRIIKAGWSINKNYYSSELLKEMVKLVGAQGPIQFSNHLEEDDKTALNRPWNDLVSYSKYVWYDEATKGVYSAVKFPKEKKDTNWIFNVIQEDPEMIGVSISAAVRVTEEFEKDGITGNRIDDWVWFDSADYVLWPSAGGVAVTASELKEKIAKAKESNKLPLSIKTSVKEKAKAEYDKMEFVLEQVRTFSSYFKDNEAYYQVQAVISSLNSYLMDCWWFAYEDAESGVTPEQRLAGITEAFNSCLQKISALDFWKNPIAQFEVPQSTTTSQESKDMTLAELKEKDPAGYEAVMKEAKAATDAAMEPLAKEVEEGKKKIATLDEANKQLAAKVDEYEVKEKAVAHRAHVMEMVKTAELDLKYVTPVFERQLLSETSDERLTEMIEDRKKLVSESSNPNTSVHKEIFKSEEVDLKAFGSRIAEEVNR
jgi:hypothetical protein